MDRLTLSAKARASPTMSGPNTAIARRDGVVAVTAQLVRTVVSIPQRVQMAVGSAGILAIRSTEITAAPTE
jgi:hypothetical protein